MLCMLIDRLQRSQRPSLSLSFLWHLLKCFLRLGILTLASHSLHLTILSLRNVHTFELTWFSAFLSFLFSLFLLFWFPWTSCQQSCKCCSKCLTSTGESSFFVIDALPWMMGIFLQSCKAVKLGESCILESEAWESESAGYFSSSKVISMIEAGGEYFTSSGSKYSWEREYLTSPPPSSMDIPSFSSSSAPASCSTST